MTIAQMNKLLRQAEYHGRDSEATVIRSAIKIHEHGQTMAADQLLERAGLLASHMSIHPAKDLAKAGRIHNRIFRNLKTDPSVKVMTDRFYTTSK